MLKDTTTDSFPHNEQTSKGWMETAAQFSRGQDFYQGLVARIGKLFGQEAFTADDGSIGDSVLALKVPELVEGLIERLKANDTKLEIDLQEEIEGAELRDCLIGRQLLRDALSELRARETRIATLETEIVRLEDTLCFERAKTGNSN